MYLEFERKRRIQETEFNQRMAGQRREILALHEQSRTRDTQIDQLVAQIRQLNREADERSVPAINQLDLLGGPFPRGHV
jgi:hypothetical protein